MHVLTYVLQMQNVSNEAVEEDAILNELRLADYVTELPLQESHFTGLAKLLEQHFGKDNLKADSSNMTITINKDGVIRFFINLRARIKRAIDLAMDRPIENFIHMRDGADWYAIKNMLEDPFATQFYMDGCGCSSMTVFAYHLFVCMEYENADSITLILGQVFDIHY